MTMVDDTWAPESPTPPGQADSPPRQVGETTLAPVAECATDLHIRVARTFDDIDAPLDRYRLYVYWRAVMEQAAVQMTEQAGHALADLQADSGLSMRKISALLAEAGCPLSASGVEQAIRRSRPAQSKAGMEIEL